MSISATRLVRYLVPAVLAAGVTAALVLQPGGGVTADDGPGVGALTDVRLAAVQANTIFLSVPSFTGGESTDPKHPNMSTAFAVTAGVSKAVAGAKPLPEPFIITKPVDAFTPQFSLAVNEGRSLPSVSLYFNKAGDKPIDVFVYNLSNVTVTRSAQDLPLGSEATEVIRLSFSMITMIYRKVAPNGTVTPFTYCWDYKLAVNCAG